MNTINIATTLSESLSLSGYSGRSYSLNWGTWTITTSQDIDEDWSYYSKAWHKSHGPKRTVSDRKITFSRKHGTGTMTRAVELDSWAGDFVANAIVALKLNTKKPVAPIRLRLNQAYDAKLVETKRGYKIYSRTILGQHHDWIIESPMGMTYHCCDRSKLIAGLHKKIRNQTREISGMINYKKVHSLGFCESGIKQFCTDFDLNIKNAYSPLEIHTRVKQNIEKAAKYLGELKILANAFGYHAPEL